MYERTKSYTNLNKTGNVLYVQRNIEVRSCNRCCSGNDKSITYSECVFVALGIQRAMSTCHVIICGLPHSKIFFDISYVTIFFGGGGEF